MKKYRIISASGADRPGIVHEVSDFVFSHGGNMEDSRMAVLGGQFSMMILFSGLDENVAAIEQDLARFKSESGLQAFIAEAIAPHKYEREPALPVRLEVVAMDAPGITVKVADVLQRHQVNIENLDARLSPAPSSGSMVFSLKMKVTVPQGVSLAEVKNDLTRLATDINLDVVFQPVHE